MSNEMAGLAEREAKNPIGEAAAGAAAEPDWEDVKKQPWWDLLRNEASKHPTAL